MISLLENRDKFIVKTWGDDDTVCRSADKLNGSFKWLLIKLYFMFGMTHGEIFVDTEHGWWHCDKYAPAKKDLEMHGPVQKEESVRPSGSSIIFHWSVGMIMQTPWIQATLAWACGCHANFST